MYPPSKENDSFSCASALESQSLAQLSTNNTTTESLAGARTIRTVTIGTVSRVISSISVALARAQDYVRLTGIAPIWAPVTQVEPFITIEKAYDPVWGMYDKSGRVALLWSMDATIAVNTKARALQASITFSQGRRGPGITYTPLENRLWRSPHVKPSSTISFGTDRDIEREKYVFQRSTITSFGFGGQTKGLSVHQQWENCISNVQEVLAFEQADGFLTMVREGEVVLFDQRVNALLRRIRDRGVELGLKYGMLGQM